MLLEYITLCGDLVSSHVNMKLYVEQLKESSRSAHYANERESNGALFTMSSKLLRLSSFLCPASPLEEKCLLINVPFLLQLGISLFFVLKHKDLEPC